MEESHRICQYAGRATIITGGNEVVNIGISGTIFRLTRIGSFAVFRTASYGFRFRREWVMSTCESVDSEIPRSGSSLSAKRILSVLRNLLMLIKIEQERVPDFPRLARYCQHSIRASRSIWREANHP